MSGTKTPLGNRGGLTQCNLKRISEFVEENLGRSIGLMEMASLVGLSTRHFIRAFSESTGDTPHQYVIGRRIERAKYLLISEKCSLTEIGLASWLQPFATFHDEIQTAHWSLSVGLSRRGAALSKVGKQCRFHVDPALSGKAWSPAFF